MTPDPHDLETLLKVRGLRVTQPRLEVLRFLASTTSHPTADDVGAAVPSASRASIYNVLHCFRDAGLVEELVFGDAVTRYDANQNPHHHFVCRACRRVEDVPADRLAVAPKSSVDDGRLIESLSVTMRGLCETCALAGAGRLGPDPS